MTKVRSELWDTVSFPARRVWSLIAIRIGIRNTGLLKLQHDVRSCEYEDIQKMWDLLHKNDDLVRSPGGKKKTCWNLIRWARRAPYLCRSF